MRKLLLLLAALAALSSAGVHAAVVLVEAPKPDSCRVFDGVQIDGALDDVRLMLEGGLTPETGAE